jgi:hypothetical protein
MSKNTVATGSPVEMTAPEQSGAVEKTFPLSISNGILRHYEALGESIWLLLQFVDWTTKEVLADDGTKLGVVLGGRPISDEYAARALGCSYKTIRRMRTRLAKHGYIEQKRTPIGYVIRVRRSKKWLSEGTKKSPHEGTKKSFHADSEGPFSPFRKPESGDPIKTVQDRAEEKPSARDGAGADSPFLKVRMFYLSEFERRNKITAPFDGRDGASLKRLLQEQKQATPEEVIGWLRNAFESTDQYPLKSGFRFWEFAAHYTKFVRGPLNGNRDASPYPAGMSRRELERRRTYLSPEARRMYEVRGTRPQ